MVLPPALFTRLRFLAMFRLMNRSSNRRTSSAKGAPVASGFGQLPIPDLVLPPLLEAALYAVFTWFFLVLLSPYALHNAPISQRFLESAGYSASVFLAVLAIRLLLQRTALGGRPSADGVKQVAQNTLRVMSIGGLNGLIGSYFDMEPLTPLLLLRYLAMTCAVAAFALLSAQTYREN